MGMSEYKPIPLLTADDIEVRVAKINQSCTGLSLLLYKNARVDMRILDECFGIENWQRKHYECKGNLFCEVGIRFGESWVWKGDCGVESYSEKAKGEASDSFKRACFNWGIGRELYSAPFIYVKASDDVVITQDKKCNTSFGVGIIGYDNNHLINYLEICTKKYGQLGDPVYTFGKKSDKPLTASETIKEKECGTDKKAKDWRITG